LSLAACSATVMAACGDDTSTAIDGGMDASKADVGGSSGSSSSGGTRDSGQMDAGNLQPCMTTMSAADCPMPIMQKCCAEMPIPTLVCKPRTATCGIFQLCEQDSECSTGQTCGPMSYLGFMIRVCRGMASDGGVEGGQDAGGGGGDAGDAGEGGGSSSGSDAGDSGSDTGATDAPSEGG